MMTMLSAIEPIMRNGMPASKEYMAINPLVPPESAIA